MEYILMVAEFLRPYTPLGIFITIFGVFIGWVYKKKNDKRQYEPRLYLENVSFKINNINVVNNGIAPIRFIDNEVANAERTYFYQSIEIQNLGKNEAKNIKIKWYIDDIDDLLSEINSFLKKMPDETKILTKIYIEKKDSYWINMERYLAGFVYPTLNDPEIIQNIKGNDSVLIKFDNSYIYLVCLLVFLRLNNLTKEDFPDLNNIDETTNQFNSLPSSVLKMDRLH